MAEHQEPETTLHWKWGSALAAGYQIIPNVLIQAQDLLKLQTADVVILLNLNLHWWSPKDLPYPPPWVIAKRMGLSRRTVERRIAALQRKGFLRRLPASGKSGKLKIRKYDLSGLVEKLEDAASVRLSQRAYRARESRESLD